MRSVAVIAFALCIASVMAAPLWEQENWRDYVKTQDFVLPGQPSSPKVDQFGGYIKVDPDAPEGQGSYFFWGVKALSNPDTAPLVIWMTGGPGCSSELAVLFECGPWRVNDDGETLSFNKYTWAQEANMVFIDQPFGVGFSQSDSEDNPTDEPQDADLMYTFLQLFLQAYPEFSGRDYYTVGESYGGKYVPGFGARIVEGNAKGEGQHINLKGIAVGDGWINPYIQYEGYVIQAQNMGWIDDHTADHLNDTVKACQKLIAKGDFGLASDVCGSIMSDVLDHVRGGNVNPYDYLLPCVVPGLCFNFTLQTNYMNLPAVQQALGVDQSWDICVNTDISTADVLTSRAYDVTTILDAGVPVTLYFGTLDVICGADGGLLVAESLPGWKHQASWNDVDFKPWYNSTAQAGVYRSAHNFTYVTVLSAGHMVPASYSGAPDSALTLFKNFLAGEVPQLFA